MGGVRIPPNMLYLFFIAHWTLCVFFQSFFQHRYAAHRMYTMGPKTERLFHFLTYLFQGASHLSPRAYAILHPEPHAFSDTADAPSSATAIAARAQEIVSPADNSASSSRTGGRDDMA